MKILSEEETEGNVTFDVELTDEETDLLVLAGLQKMIEDSGLPVVAVRASKMMKVSVKSTQHDLSEEEVSLLVNLGFNKVIKEFLDRLDEEKPQKDDVK